MTGERHAGILFLLLVSAPPAEATRCERLSIVLVLYCRAEIPRRPTRTKLRHRVGTTSHTPLAGSGLGEEPGSFTGLTIRASRDMTPRKKRHDIAYRARRRCRIGFSHDMIDGTEEELSAHGRAMIRLEEAVSRHTA